MTALEWLENQLKSTYMIEGKLPLAYTLDLVRQAKQMEQDKRKELIEIVYNIGYTDAQCSHVNDADNLAYEISYMQSQIDNIDKEIKDRENKIADMLIDNMPDPEVKGYTIGPFGTPEKL